MSEFPARSQPQTGKEPQRNVIDVGRILGSYATSVLYTIVINKIESAVCV